MKHFQNREPCLYLWKISSSKHIILSSISFFFFFDNTLSFFDNTLYWIIWMIFFRRNKFGKWKWRTGDRSIHEFAANCSIKKKFVIGYYGLWLTLGICWQMSCASLLGNMICWSELHLYKRRLLYYLLNSTLLYLFFLWFCCSLWDPIVKRIELNRIWRMMMITFLLS